MVVEVRIREVEVRVGDGVDENEEDGEDEDEGGGEDDASVANVATVANSEGIGHSHLQLEQMEEAMIGSPHPQKLELPVRHQ